MKKILVSVSNDLSTDQRVEKICATLSENKFEVTLVGRLKKNSKPITRNYKVKRFQMAFHKGVLFYAEYNIRLFFYLLKTNKDILYSNDVDTLLPNYLVSRLQTKQLIFDSHELFSEVPEIIHKPLVKKFWKGIEDYVIPKLKYIITVSNGIKNHYKKLYNVNASVIRNVPKTTNISKERFPLSTKDKKVIIYQGAVNIGRGIELMIDTIKLLPNYTLVIAGDGDILEDLKQKVLNEKLENQIKFLGRISPKKLKKITPLATLGLSLEEDLGLNYRYTLPNKLFDYIQAEIPVIVSNLPEMSAIINQFKLGKILKKRKPEYLAKMILEIEQNDFDLQLKEAKKDLNWEKEEKKLLGLLNKI